MADSFDERMNYLSEVVGTGSITAGVDVDQPYAQDQHETPYRHRVGQMKYLSEPFFTDATSLVEKIALSVITEEGSDLTDTMQEISEDMAGYVEAHAPVDTGRLRESASPYVVDNGVESYRRPAIAPRENDQAPRYRRGN